MVESEWDLGSSGSWSGVCGWWERLCLEFPSASVDGGLIGGTVVEPLAACGLRWWAGLLSGCAKVHARGTTVGVPVGIRRGGRGVCQAERLVVLADPVRPAVLLDDQRRLAELVVDPEQPVLDEHLQRPRIAGDHLLGVEPTWPPVSYTMSRASALVGGNGHAAAEHLRRPDLPPFTETV